MLNKNSLRYRPAIYEDIPTLCGLLEELFTLESDFQPDRHKQTQALQKLIDKFATNPDTPPCVVWVAELDGQVIGMCSLQILLSTAEGGNVGLVEDVIIDVDYRGQGVGQQILHSLETWALEHGLSRLQLLADVHNTRAIEFYERQGWHQMQMLALRKALKA
jgi:GNAT superfamily N-acetyltransferase